MRESRATITDISAGAHMLTSCAVATSAAGWVAAFDPGG